MTNAVPEVNLHFNISSDFHGQFSIDPTTGVVTVSGLANPLVGQGESVGKSLDDFPDGALAAPMVARHEKSGRKGTRSREMAVVLLGRGWVCKPGPKYFRWIFEGKDRRATLYQNSKDILTRDDPKHMETIGKPTPTKSGVRWRYDGQSFDAALEALAAIEGWANGNAPTTSVDPARARGRSGALVNVGG